MYNSVARHLEGSYCLQNEKWMSRHQLCNWHQAYTQTEKATAPHSSTLAWQIPWTEEPGRLQSMRSLRVRQDWATSLSLSLSCLGEGNGNPLQCSCLENPRDREAWWAAVYGVPQSRTRLKRLSSSSSVYMSAPTLSSPVIPLPIMSTCPRCSIEALY